MTDETWIFNIPSQRWQMGKELPEMKAAHATVIKSLIMWIWIWNVIISALLTCLSLWHSEASPARDNCARHTCSCTRSSWTTGKWCPCALRRPVPATATPSATPGPSSSSSGYPLLESRGIERLRGDGRCVGTQYPGSEFGVG